MLAATSGTTLAAAPARVPRRALRTSSASAPAVLRRDMLPSVITDFAFDAAERHPLDLPKHQMSQRELDWVNSDFVNEQADYFEECMKLEQIEDNTAKWHV
jgi:hypothetical protein